MVRRAPIAFQMWDSLSHSKRIVGWHSHYDQLTRMRTVAKGGPVSKLKRNPAEIEGQFEFLGRKETIADYLDHNPVTGFLIARDDTILLEHYQYARTDSDPFLSNSMAKTVTGLLVGIAISEGAIHSIDDTAATYVPELKGTEYGNTPIRALLQWLRASPSARRTSRAMTFSN